MITGKWLTKIMSLGSVGGRRSTTFPSTLRRSSTSTGIFSALPMMRAVSFVRVVGEVLTCFQFWFFACNLLAKRSASSEPCGVIDPVLE